LFLDCLAIKFYTNEVDIVKVSFYCKNSFLTSPDKVNGLQGFNFSWTEVRRVQSKEIKNFKVKYKVSLR